ncbi:hypothetical protein KM1_208020 [Entamoeba histolytica HM-3:IMSS]|uniref:Uncharacterized protein n=1 Tax=Entamoeba histolytica HM-3:IMSS TaxID=885315 RepID=M7WWL6_ENTHI|nr:hypothetical protein KM1_208020 [Entamoeba histolytica HM-3:IMSS]
MFEKSLKLRKITLKECVNLTKHLLIEDYEKKKHKINFISWEKFIDDYFKRNEELRKQQEVIDVDALPVEKKPKKKDERENYQETLNATERHRYVVKQLPPELANKIIAVHEQGYKRFKKLETIPTQHLHPNAHQYYQKIYYGLKKKDPSNPGRAYFVPSDFKTHTKDSWSHDVMVGTKKDGEYHTPIPPINQSDNYIPDQDIVKWIDYGIRLGKSKNEWKEVMLRENEKSKPSISSYIFMNKK